MNALKQKSQWLTPTNLLLTIVGTVLSLQFNLRMEDDKLLKKQVREELLPTVENHSERLDKIDQARIEGDDMTRQLMNEKGQTYNAQFDMVRDELNWIKTKI